MPISTTSLLPLLVGLGGVAGLMGGLLLAGRLRHPRMSQSERERLQDQAAKRAAEKAVREVIARLR